MSQRNDTFAQNREIDVINFCPFFEPNLLGRHFILQNQDVIQPIFQDLKNDFIIKSGKKKRVGKCIAKRQFRQFGIAKKLCLKRSQKSTAVHPAVQKSQCRKLLARECVSENAGVAGYVEAFRYVKSG